MHLLHWYKRTHADAKGAADELAGGDDVSDTWEGIAARDRGAATPPAACC